MFKTKKKLFTLQIVKGSMGGACKNLEIYKVVSDENGVKVGSWAIQKDSGLAGDGSSNLYRARI